MKCVSVENMRLSDAYTIANFVAGTELMYRAAMGVFKAVSWYGDIGIVVGSGNNGGDGFALACILKENGYSCRIFTISQRLSSDSAFFAEKVREMDIPTLPFHTGCLIGCAIVVDCLLGTGFWGEVRENYRRAIEEINHSGAYVVSVDINSGMNGDTGEAELAVYSDLTVTIGFVKLGLIQDIAGRYIKKLVCADIGIALVKEEFQICGPGEALLPMCCPCPPWLDMNVIMV